MDNTKDTRDDDILTLDDVAKYIKVTPAKIIQWIKNYNFPYHTFLGSYVFNEKEVTNWILSQDKKSEPEEFVIIQKPCENWNTANRRLPDGAIQCRLAIKRYKGWSPEDMLEVDVKVGAGVCEKLTEYKLAYSADGKCLALMPEERGYKFKKYKSWVHYTLNIKVGVKKVPFAILDYLRTNGTVIVTPTIDSSGNIIIPLQPTEE